MSEKADMQIPPEVADVIRKALRDWHGAPCTWILVAMIPADVALAHEYIAGTATAESPVPNLLIGFDNCDSEFAAQMVANAAVLAIDATEKATGTKH